MNHTRYQRQTARLATGELLMLSQNAVHKVMPAEKDDIAVNFIVLPEFFDRAFTLLAGQPSPVADFLCGCLFPEKSESAICTFWLPMFCRCRICWKTSSGRWRKKIRPDG